MIKIASANASDFMEMLAERFNVEIDPDDQTSSSPLGGDYVLYLSQEQKNKLCRTIKQEGPDR
jgi:hypothetical protein